MAKRKRSKEESDLPQFETSLGQLKESLSALESGDLTLQQSLEQYESGIRHLQECHLALENAKQKIELLVDIDEDGNMVTRPFDGSASDAAATGTRRRKSSGQSRDGSSEKKIQSPKKPSSKQAIPKSSPPETFDDNDVGDEVDDNDGLF